MNYKEWSAKKFWAVLLGVFLLGGFFVMSSKDTTVKEVVKEVPATCDYSDWKDLKEIDDTAIGYSVDVIGLCSEGFIAVSNFDINGMESVTNRINAMTPKIEAIGDKRLDVLEKLGY